MGVDTKVGGRKADAGKEQHSGPGTAAQGTERSRGHKPTDATVFKKHVGSNDTNDNCGTDCIPDLGSG